MKLRETRFIGFFYWANTTLPSSVICDGKLRVANRAPCGDRPTFPTLNFPQGIKLDGSYLILPKLGKVYCKVSLLPEGKLKYVTVSLTSSGEYYAACLYDDGKDTPGPSSEGKAIGIDMGINHYAITSDGRKHGNPKYYRKYEIRLAKRQKLLSRKQKGSANRNKARIKVAKIHAKITRCREYFIHKLSRKLVDENQVIVVEHLAVSHPVKNNKVAK